MRWGRPALHLQDFNVSHIFNAMLNVPHPAPLDPSEPVNPADRADDDRTALADALLDELSRWGPRERAGMLRTWHRGSLSIIHLTVLNLLEAEGWQSMGQLAEDLDVSVASVTGIVDRMERRGLVERERGTGDRRVIMVDLTDAGRAVFSEMSARRRERLTRLVEGLSRDEMAGLVVGLRAMHAAGSRIFNHAVPSAAVTAPLDDVPTVAAAAAEPRR